VSPGTLALSADLRQIADEVALWCEKTCDTPRDGARALMSGTAALAARAAANGRTYEAGILGRRFVAFELYLERLEGVRR
jgi:hypothetical protein